MNLEEYIRQNAGAFDTEEPREGHELRFLAKAGEKRRRFRALPLASAAIAAALAAVMVLLPHGTPATDDAVRAETVLEGTGPAEVYLSYLNEYQKLCESVTDIASETAIEAVAVEAVPMLEQLPDELSDAEKAEILRSHYGALLEGMNNIVKL